MPSSKRLAARASALAGLSALLVSSAASAQEARPKVGQAFGDWSYNCTAIAQDETVCGITQTIVAGEQRQPIAQLRISQMPQSDDLRFTIVLPLGLSLPVGLSVAIDNDPPVGVELQTCLPRGCIASMALPGRAADEFAGGEKITLNYTLSARNAPVSLTGSLNGVAEAFEATGWR